MEINHIGLVPWIGIIFTNEAMDWYYLDDLKIVDNKENRCSHVDP